MYSSVHVDTYSGPFTLLHWDTVLSIELHDSTGDYDVNINEALAKVVVEETRCKGSFKQFILHIEE